MSLFTKISEDKKYMNKDEVELFTVNHDKRVSSIVIQWDHWHYLV